MNYLIRSIAIVRLTPATVVLTVAIQIGIGVIVLPVRAAQSQTAVRPEFEVSSIKQNISGNNAAQMSLSSGRMSVQSSTVQNLILFAYDVRPYQISHGPDWLTSDRYDIEAKAQATATREQIKLMLQTLLEARFHLRLHRETKEQPVLALTVAKSGIRMQLFKEGSCINPNAPGAEASSQTKLSPCGNSESGKGQRRELRSTSMDMVTLARGLSFDLQRPVIDQTGLSGNFALDLVWNPDATATTTNSDVTDSSRPIPDQTVGLAPSIFTALQEQLGLKLESTKGQVEVFVIDHVERPEEN